MHARHSLLLGLAAVLAAAAPLSAQVVFDNGAPDAAGGNEMSAWIQAEDFALGTPTTIGAVRFWGFGMTPSSYQGGIHWQILTSAGGAPGAALAGGLATPTRTYRAETGFGPSYQYDFSIAPLALGEGIYWLALHNGPLTTTGRSDFYWESTGSNQTASGMEDGDPFGGGWSANGREHAFQLLGTQQSVVPEPGSILLTATGMLVVGAGALRRRRRSA